jgi:glycosyltransferase involved in cell wall biosynthesis/SAM-dependent methyltransferase
MSRIRIIIRNVIPYSVRNILYPYAHFFLQIIVRTYHETKNNYQQKYKLLIVREGRESGFFVKYFGIRLFKFWLKIDSLIFGILFIFYIVVRKIYLMLWDRSLDYRHLLAEHKSRPNIKTLIANLIFSALFHVANIHYRRAFNKYDKYSSPITLNEKYSGIIHAIGSLGPGGSERQLIMTVTSLAKIKDVKVFCEYLSSDSDRFFIGELESINVETLTVSSQSLIMDEELRTLFQAQISILPTSMRDKVLLYAGMLVNNPSQTAHFWLDSVCTSGGIAAVLAGVPKIILGLRSLPPYHFAFHQPYMREAYCWLAKQPGVTLINNSHAGAREYEKWLALPENTIRVIHNGFNVNADKFKENYVSGNSILKTKYEIPDASLIIGTVIRFSEEKNPMLWLDIAAKLNELDQNIHFLMVGDGPLLDVAKQKIVNSGMNNHIHFVGRTYDAYEHISAMDIFLLTSRLEGLPNVLIESQLLGVPVVTTRAGGAPETLINKVTGWVVENNDANQIAMILHRLIHDESWLKQAGVEGRIFAKNTFSVEKMSAGFESIYGPMQNNLIKENNARRFEFGKNWESYIKANFSEEALGESKVHLLRFLELQNLQDKTFLDIGCGSGLHSLAALDAGATHVHGFDYDPVSIKATKYLRDIRQDHPNWEFEQASVLDDEYMNKLSLFDIVYSWGVLHHTGDVWHAIKNAASRVKPGGVFYIALYSADVQIEPGPEFWLGIKKKYVSSGVIKRRWMELWYIWRFMMESQPLKILKVIKRAWEYEKDRGMNFMTDIRDWLGGWPMEFVYDDDVVKFCEGLDFQLEKIVTGEANTEFLFRRALSKE